MTRFPEARVAAGWERTAVGAESQLRSSARTTGTAAPNHWPVSLAFT